MLRGYELLEDRSAPDGLFDVYQARAPDGALVVLRRLRVPGVAEALKDQLEKAQRLTHASAAPILDMGRLGASLYFTQPWFDGARLRALVDHRAWTVAEAAGVLVPLLGALSDAHHLGLLHQEVAADNVFVTPDGVALVDFGLASVAQLAGIPLRRACVSPEQAQGRPPTPHSDVFQAGLLLFELLTGRLPALGTVSEVAARIAMGELDSPRDAGITDDAVVALLERALAFEPKARFSSAQEFSRALAVLAPAPVDVSRRLSRVLHTAPWPPPARPDLEPVPDTPPEPLASAPKPGLLRRLFTRPR
ncbi:MAG: protein kinase [Myxococcota bacterium]